MGIMKHMRVVGGTARGRRLTAPAGHQVRPTADRVRQAVFNMLASRGAPTGLAVADLFSGTGAMGIEALSRGASSVVMVDSDATAVRAIEANLASTGFDADPRASVVRADAVAWVPQGRLGLILCDPPYAFDDWGTLLRRAESDLFLAESDRTIQAQPGWDVLVSRRYGTTVVTLLGSVPLTAKGGS
ncbi:MAG: RsmD family RNA methyltransferase [Acidimicrobiales bacterium]